MGHVLFNGSVPGDKRGALVDQFRNDPNCRLFLSTGAGGAGLNQQHVVRGSGEKVLACLSRYLDRGVIQERDNIRCENGQISFQ